MHNILSSGSREEAVRFSSEGPFGLEYNMRMDVAIFLIMSTLDTMAPGLRIAYSFKVINLIQSNA